ncbi:uncharacterized protein FOMMEDRAFT_158427 [Fomitiporia mediterranea MF3/22]|uniref:uncharacterized protein n=1 Tax=Fomitiporia mediterranea (strain MF3/22) TaxID=694068 RepID=UPI0004407784|nr:uncharacterized protein FOMMEDRAFT_158427 [Fomitiporia mediterranea MF3/22]EJD01293.1 hypothetical protein FOMMEDRAFT_158427 [Fomitiporia mediterranea MF3/22]
MDNFILPAVHLSSVFASSEHVPTHAVQTEQRDVPLAMGRSDMPDDHASISSLFHSAETGHVLIRVVQGGLAVELVSLSYDVAPIRFVFPAAAVPNPALTIFNGRVYLIVVTVLGILFRINLPCSADGQLWHGPLSNKWCKEWQIKKLSGAEAKLVHVHDAHDIAISLSTGGYLRLENKIINGRENNQWTETEWRSSSWYSALFPAIAAGHDSPGAIVSMASAPSPTDISDLFSVSRDRILRRWTVAKGCRTEIALDAPKSGSEAPTSLLDMHPQKLLQVIRATVDTRGDLEDEESLNVLVFLPNPASHTSCGSFRIYNTDHYQWRLLSSFESSPESAYCKLQDFRISGNTLYVLWEKQGESLLEMTYVNLENLSQRPHSIVQTVAWSRARLDQYSKLNQDAMNELLLQPGSLTNKFLQSILRPGLFSVVTLRAALKEYKEHYLSLPGPHPTPLLAEYTSLGESIAAVVGCTVALSRDPQTGATLHNQYWNALRRDWEGFVARCTEIERSARWPVCLGLDVNGQVLVVERERISQCVEEDTSMRVHRQVSSAANTDTYHLLETCWGLRTKLPEPLVRQIERETGDILHQEVAFPLADVLIKAANKVFYKDDLDEDIEVWVHERVSSLEDFETALRDVLEVIAGLDKAVKQEEDEVELIIPPAIVDWTRALATSYITETIEIRYDLCLALAALLFFISDDLKQKDPALIAEVFAIIRGVAMCRYLCRQPAGDSMGARPMAQESSTTDDVVTRLSSMHVSRETKAPPTYSLTHQLLIEYGHPPILPAAAHHFLNQLGLLNSISPAHVTRNEVLICEKLRHMGYYESSRYLLTWLPRSPAVCYVFGRLWIDVGREDEAVALLQGVSGSFVTGNVLLSDDLQTLDAVFPNGCCRSDCEYYLHIAELFKKASMTAQELHFLRLALSVWPEGAELDEISLNTWAAIIKGYSDLGLYEDAYCYLISSPHHDQRHQYVSNLVYKMCENDALNRLLSMNFRGLVQEVESALSFKARNADPRSLPNWSQILYTWYTVRGDYRNAALTMYIRYRNLSELPVDSTMPLALLEQQAETLSVAMNALGLVETKNAFIVVPTHESSLPPRKRRKIGSYLPKEQLSASQRNVDIVRLPDIEREYAHLTANLELIRRDPTLVRHGEPHLTPWLTVSKLTQAGLFDLAMHTAKTLSIDMSEVFQRLSLQCLHLSASLDTDMAEFVPSDWLLTDKVSSWPGSPADRGWRYLRQCLERYDSAETDYSYSKAVLETVLANDSSSPPSWLLQIIEEHHPEHLIRTYLRFGDIEEALEQTLKLIRKATKALDNSTPKHSSCTWLPYMVVDAVLKSSEENVSAKAQTLRQSVQSELSNRDSRLQKQTAAIPAH